MGGAKGGREGAVTERPSATPRCQGPQAPKPSCRPRSQAQRLVSPQRAGASPLLQEPPRGCTQSRDAGHPRRQEGRQGAERGEGRGGETDQDRNTETASCLPRKGTGGRAPGNEAAGSQLSVPLCTHRSPGRAARRDPTQCSVGRKLRQQGIKWVAGVTPATACCSRGSPIGVLHSIHHPPAHLRTCQKTRQRYLPKFLTKTPCLFRTRFLMWS